MRLQSLVFALLLSIVLAACSDNDTSVLDGQVSGDAGLDGAEPDITLVDAGAAPGPSFKQYCGSKPWYASRKPATVGKLSGKYWGFITGLGSGAPFSAWTLETVKVIPEHPFRVDKIRVAFAKGTGKARIRLMTTLGRSVPGPYPTITSEKHDLIKPVTVEIKDPDPKKWIEIDVSSEGVFLLPTQHYMIVYQHLAKEPHLAMEVVPEGEFPRSFLFVPTSKQTYGLSDGKQSFNYRMELSGSYFCSWDASKRWWSEDKSQAFSKETAYRLSLTDLDGDGNDDMIINGSKTVNGKSEAHPQAFLGDGKGGFTRASTDPFPDARAASLLVFGDLDNDGDRDAVAFTNVPADRDGDGVLVAGGAKVDCNDADKNVYPGATESVNGYDDDCDGVADDGKDTSDADGDGKSIAAGDCDDKRKDVYPGAPELLDGRDNDCDKKVDEEFTNRILLNDGKGNFVTKKGAGVEVLDPTSSAALGDGDGDGKLDVYWGNWLITYPLDAAVPDRYFTGKGDGTFIDAQKKAGLTLKLPYSVYGVTFTDYNNDGHQDIIVSNYHLFPNQLWQNKGDGTFVDVAAKLGVAQDDIAAPTYLQDKGMTGGHSYGVDFADVDNDGDMDYFFTNLSHPREQPWSDPSMFAVNQGAPGYTFKNKTKEYGFIYDEGDVNVAFGDFDNDMDQDVVIATVYPGHFSKVYRNDGKAGFVDVTYQTGALVHEAVAPIWVDADNDGDLDLLIAGRGTGARGVHLYKNGLKNGNGWVKLKLQGKTSNRDAVGARVRLTAGGVTQMMDVRGGEGHFNPQRPLVLHFGLGKATSVTSVKVRWVGGASETISGVSPGGKYTIVEGTGKAVLVKK